jgi:hypothetical protein
MFDDAAVITAPRAGPPEGHPAHGVIPGKHAASAQTAAGTGAAQQPAIDPEPPAHDRKVV